MSTTQLLAQVCCQGDWLRAPVDLLMRRGAVAGGIVGRTVKDLTPVAGTEDVGVCCEGVAPFSAQLILTSVVSKILVAKECTRLGKLTVHIVWVGRKRIAQEERLIQCLCLGDLNSLQMPTPVRGEYCKGKMG